MHEILFKLNKIMSKPASGKIKPKFHLLLQFWLEGSFRACGPRARTLRRHSLLSGPARGARSRMAQQREAAL
jgi:hypothetical protein